MFLKYDGDELVGVCGVYVDDFIIAGKHNGQKWQIEKDRLKKLYKWGKWETDTFTLCGVRYVQKKDYSVKMDQQEFTAKLTTAEMNLPKTYIGSTERTNLMRKG